MSIQQQIDQAFAGLSHAFPAKAEFQGQHFAYAAKNGFHILETKKTVFTPCGSCPTCGQQRGEKERRFFYWLWVDSRWVLVHAALETRFKGLKTVGQSIPSLALMHNPA